MEPKSLVNILRANTPTHVLPSPVNPGKQVQSNPSGVSEHSAFSSQSWLLSRHSSESGEKIT